MSAFDQKLLQNALARNWLTAPQVGEILRLQQQLQSQGQQITLREILLDEDYLLIEQIEELEKSLEQPDQNETMQPQRTPLPFEAQKEISDIGKSFIETPQDETIFLNNEEQIIQSSADQEENKSTYVENEMRSDSPEQFGERYQIIKELGQGNVGRVFLAQDTLLQRRVALKVLLSGAMATEETIERFQREAQAVARIKHPNIVSMYDSGKHENNYYITMEFIEGQSLDDILKEKKRLTTKTAAGIIAKIARALYEAHQQDIIHRDIKPANIMIDKEGNPYVTDFGMARTVKESSRMSKTGTIMGTPSYMPPEQAKGRTRKLDARSDIYSLGATLFEAVTGQVPFPGKDVMTTLMRVVNDPVPAPSMISAKLPKEIDKICMKCMQKEQKDRYQNAQQLARDLEKYIEGKTIKTTVRQRRPKWQYLTAGTLAALILLTILISIAWPDKQNKKKKPRKTTKTRIVKIEKKNGKEEESEEDKKRKDWKAKKDLWEAKKDSWRTLIRSGELPKEINDPQKLQKQFSEMERYLPNSSESESSTKLLHTRAIFLLLKKNDNIEIAKRQKLLTNTLQELNSFQKQNRNKESLYLEIALLGLENSWLFCNKGDTYKTAITFLENFEQNHYLYHLKKCYEIILKYVNTNHKKEGYEKALVSLEEAEKLQEHCAMIYTQKGIIYRVLGRYDKALNAFNKAINVEDKSQFPYLEIGEIYIKKAQNEKNEKSNAYLIKAQNYLNKAISIAPYDYNVYISLAVLIKTKKETDKYNDAIKYLEEAIKKGAEPRICYKIMAKIYRDLGNYKKFIEYQNKSKRK